MRLQSGLHLAIATPEQRDRALEHTHHLWGGKLSLADYQRRTAEWIGSAWGREHYHFYVVLGPDREIHAACKVYELPMWALGRPVRTIGFGAVFTVPEQRGRGIASRMLRALMEYYQERGFRLATLFAEIEPALYERLGFHQLASKVCRASCIHLPPPPQGVEWRLPTAADAGRLAELQEATARSFSLAYGRTANLWSFELTRSHATPAVLERSGEILGYAAFEAEGDELWLHDWAVAEPAAAEAIVRAAPLWYPEASQLFGWLPDGAPAADLPFEVDDRDKAIWMVAPLGSDSPPIAALTSGPHHAWLLEQF